MHNDNEACIAFIPVVLELAILREG